MTRIDPKQIQDTLHLSGLLDRCLTVLEQPPLQVRLRALSYDTRIPEAVFNCLRNAAKQPEATPPVCPEDYHFVFSSILSRFPTLKIWADDNGTICFEL